MHNQLYKNGPVAVVVGLSITGLGIIRSLARFGIRTIALDSNPYRPTAQTKYCEKVHYADINKEDKLIETLIAISEMNKTKPVLFFSTDNSVLIASENREVLADYYHFNLPSRSVVRIFMDKALFGDFAGKNGFQIPETLVANNFDDIRSVAKNVQYPCVIKPSLRTPTWDKTNPDKAFKVFSEEQLINVYKNKSILTTKFIIQEWIPGADSEVYFCLLWYNALSEPIASFTGRKVMQWPPEMGSTCIAESWQSDPLLNRSINLFDAVQYKGIGSVEFKRDPRDSVFKITEPTVGRVDLQSEIAYYSGVNIPLLEYCDCSGFELPESVNQNRKIYWINEENLFWLLANQKDRYSLKEWLKPIRNRRAYAFFDPFDIKPFFMFLRWIAGRLGQKLKR